MNKFFLTFVGLLFFSCGNDLEMASYKVVSEASTEERSVDVIELQGENFGPEGQFGYLTDILLVNSSLVFQDIKKEYAFSHLEDGEKLSRFQPIGLGKGEVENADFVKIVDYDEMSKEIHFFNYSTKSLSSISVLPNSVPYIYGAVPGLYWGDIQSAVGLNDSLVAITGRFSDAKFIIFNKNTQKEVLRSKYLNSFPNELSEEARISVSPTDIKYNDKHELVVLNKPSVNSIDVYSTNGAPEKFYSFGEMRNISDENIFSRDYFYYYSVKTHGDVAYGLYLGMRQDVMAVQDVFASRTRPELHVYNLVTDDLQRFKLDRLVNACVLNTESSILYCIEENNEDQPLVRYEIPKI
ncbi:hypothetical protein FUA23_22030 [Neolewinella aurantiaca]|uniref:6-bladed beta-propeller n=1 Tax=Neolewinella aurantiaca TaxID=2602767 RepID=A0A5C7FFJ0_9BACT|nr:hypothetical protein [Neolewinella aurantiaca]TXF81310.1 hypothetical protein FUA23_22030 [Neolewinella aurantiaca]